MTTTKLTVSDIEAGYENPEWLGWGYLGERQNESPSKVARADRIVLRWANERGYSPEDLFEWLNSRPGRHFGDDAFAPARYRSKSADLGGYFPTVETIRSGRW